MSKHMQGVQTFSTGHCVYSCSIGIYCSTVRAPYGTAKAHEGNTLWRTLHQILNSTKCRFFLLVLQPPSGVVFYSPLAGFSLLACEVS